MRTRGGVKGRRRHKRFIKAAKGYKWGRSKRYRAAKEALLHARAFAYHDRKKKKGDFRAVWNININAGARALGVKYSALIPALKAAKIELNRKMLAELAEHEPAAFAAVVKAAGFPGKIDS